MISTVHKICNPSMVSFLGYVPIDKQFKVLYSNHFSSLPYVQHQVLTLGTQKLEWRMIKCCVPHHSLHDGICINGVLYYPVCTRGRDMIGCFHVRSETFSFIEVETTSIGAVFLKLHKHKDYKNFSSY